MITIKKIFKKTTDYKIFCYYLSPFIDGKEPNSSENILSPLREEKSPSFNIYESPKGWRFKDYGGEQGNCFKFIMLLFNLTFEQTLKKINDDMNLEIPEEYSNSNAELEHCKIISGKSYKIYAREFSKQELELLESYGISIEILSLFGVISIEALDGFSKKKNKSYRMRSGSGRFLFGYPYSKTCIKIYQPQAEKKHRFFYVDPNERDKEFVFGLEQVPQTGKVVIWTGGEKDVMSLTAMGFHAITGTSETGRVSVDVFKSLKERGFEVVILFDNDKTGMEKSEQFSKEYGFRRAVLPEMQGGGKDISDYAKLKLPLDEIFQLIENASVVPQDVDGSIFFEDQIKQIGIPSEDVSTTVLSETEFAYDIWVFGFNKKGYPILKGLYRNGIMQHLHSKGYYKRCRDNNTYLLIREECNRKITMY